jgi:hypothetical protein
VLAGTSLGEESVERVVAAADGLVGRHLTVGLFEKGGTRDALVRGVRPKRREIGPIYLDAMFCVIKKVSKRREPAVNGRISDRSDVQQGSRSIQGTRLTETVEFPTGVTDLNTRLACQMLCPDCTKEWYRRRETDGSGQEFSVKKETVAGRQGSGPVPGRLSQRKRRDTNRRGWKCTRAWL